MEARAFARRNPGIPSLSRDRAAAGIPDFASLHPGYETAP
jgi:hypothetical protein